MSLLNAADQPFFGEPMLSVADVVSAWAEPGFDLAADSEAWVDEDGQLVGLATLDPRGVAELAVASDWTATGLDDALADWYEREAPIRGMRRVSRYLADADHDGLAALRRRGYAWQHTSWVLTLDETSPIQARDLPGGYAVRPMTEADAPAVHAVVRDAFAEWGGQHRSYPTWRAALIDRADVTLAHSRVATWRGAVVGVGLVIDRGATATDRRAETWVAQLAVHIDHRGRGLAQQLLGAVYLAARRRGVGQLGLSTDTRTGALGLYNRLGLVVRHTLHNYALEFEGRPEELVRRRRER